MTEARCSAGYLATTVLTELVLCLGRLLQFEAGKGSEYRILQRAGHCVIVVPLHASGDCMEPLVGAPVNQNRQLFNIKLSCNDLSRIIKSFTPTLTSATGVELNGGHSWLDCPSAVSFQIRRKHTTLGLLCCFL